jgi:hypothetical protein
MGKWSLIAALFALLALTCGIAYHEWSQVAIDLPPWAWAVMLMGAILTILVGVGLMSLIFYSSRMGYDEPPHQIPIRRRASRVNCCAPGEEVFLNASGGVHSRRTVTRILFWSACCCCDGATLRVSLSGPPSLIGRKVGARTGSREPCQAPSTQLHRIFGDAKGGKINCRIHRTKLVLTLDSENKNANDLERHVAVTDARNLGPPHKRGTDDAACRLTTLRAIDRTDRCVLISSVGLDIMDHLLLRIADQDVTDFDVPAVNHPIDLGTGWTAQQHRKYC